MVYYPTLEREIVGCGIKKKDIADSLGICYKALANKLAGKTEFTWAEVCKVTEQFFRTWIKTICFLGRSGAAREGGDDVRWNSERSGGIRTGARSWSIHRFY